MAKHAENSRNHLWIESNSTNDFRYNRIEDWKSRFRAMSDATRNTHVWDKMNSSGSIRVKFANIIVSDETAGGGHFFNFLKLDFFLAALSCTLISIYGEKKWRNERTIKRVVMTLQRAVTLPPSRFSDSSTSLVRVKKLLLCQRQILLVFRMTDCWKLFVNRRSLTLRVFVASVEVWRWLGLAFCSEVASQHKRKVPNANDELLLPFPWRSST